MIKVHCERIKFGQSYVAHFRGEVSDGVDEEKLPEVSLSRIPDHCFFRIDKLDEHDSHAPDFKSLEEVNAYIERVFRDIRDKLVELEIIVETEVESVKGIPILVPMPTMNTDSDN